MIRVFFLEQCRSSKRWLRSCFATMRCDIKRSVVGRGDT
jgi:hypothetical protein